MKRLALIGLTVFGMAAAPRAAGFEGIGFDAAANDPQAVVRFGIGEYMHIEGGLGFNWQNDEITGPGVTSTQSDDAMLTLAFSGRFLLALHQWDKLTGFLHAGLYFRDDQVHGDLTPPSNRAAALYLFGGYQPEVQLLPHLAVSTKFGVMFPVLPSAGFSLTGERISIVDGFDFRILF